jgi:pimeloyl-ACP methyl ester carboxylesterase
VLGEGPPDLVLAPGSFGHLDIGWGDPGITLFCRTLASFCRLIIFDRRGTGISDPLPPHPLPPWEAFAEELARSWTKSAPSGPRYWPRSTLAQRPSSSPRPSRNASAPSSCRTPRPNS